nr:hypothetical protein [Actinomadura sp. WAC 06369]
MRVRYPSENLGLAAERVTGCGIREQPRSKVFDGDGDAAGLMPGEDDLALRSLSEFGDLDVSRQAPTVWHQLPVFVWISPTTRGVGTEVLVS